MIRVYEFLKQFAYDSKWGGCKSFIWGGCGANGNNFGSMPECRISCENGQQRIEFPRKSQQQVKLPSPQMHQQQVKFPPMPQKAVKFPPSPQQKSKFPSKQQQQA
ncbi:Kunitz/Bovine pancreatic trypsin inhibitor domain protein [Ancylostoma caninum]|uniref:Kunitz/Bovine pancreatic trypsin inhibitor domain protein n=1 Tax=Ancylostoma caninum TaxID=29170 RepID=A0A368FL87_ANCCA|nr:Kunitz/Bovine pancreatic trypsin inhibitor domain protein [Ancylostoma caninum]